MINSETDLQPTDYSDAALSVYLTVEPAKLTGSYRGERYAVTLTELDGSHRWYGADEDAASAHGRRFGWDRVAAVAPQQVIEAWSCAPVGLDGHRWPCPLAGFGRSGVTPSRANVPADAECTDQGCGQ